MPGGPFKFTIKNKITNPICVGIFGIESDATFRVELDAGATFVTPSDEFLIGGNRMVVVWDTVGPGNPAILFSEKILVLGETGLDIKASGIFAFTPV